MRVYKEVSSAYDFEFWGGAKDTVKYLLDHEVNIIFDHLEMLNPEGMTETEVNDFFWFDRDSIAKWLGYDDFEEIINNQ